MKKFVKRFSSFEEENKAEEEYYKNLSYEERLKILVHLIGHEDPADGTVQRHLRIYPITEPRKS